MSANALCCVLYDSSGNHRLVVPVSARDMVCCCTAGARLPLADKAAHVPQDQVFQLLASAVYSPAGDAERANSLQQLSSMTSRLQEPPGLANDVAVFSNRCVGPELVMADRLCKRLTGAHVLLPVSTCCNALLGSDEYIQCMELE